MKFRHIKGRTIDQKLLSIDGALHWILPRVRKRVIGAIPPIPIDEFVEEPDENGIILRKFFVLKGIIKNGLMRVGELPKQAPTLTITIETDMGGSHVDVPLKQVMSVSPNLPVEPGHRMTISVSPAEDVKNIWLGFLLEPILSEMSVQKQLLEQVVPMLEAERKEFEKESEVEDAQEDGTKA